MVLRTIDDIRFHFFLLIISLFTNVIKNIGTYMYTMNNSSDHDTIQIHTMKHLLNKSLDWYNDIVLSMLF